MVNPYGITQVDIPGALNVLEQARSNRIRQMMLQRQLDQDERTQERETGVRTALARFAGTAQPGKAGEAAPVAPTGMAAAYAPPTAAPPAAPPASAPASVPAVAPPAAGTGDRQRLFSELLTLDPETATRVITAFHNMDEAAATRASTANEAIARLGTHLLSNVPEPDWAAEIQRRAPDLLAHGVTQEQIAGFQPTRQNIQYVIAQARDIEKIIEDARPRLREVAGQVIDERALPAGTPQDPVVFESEFIDTPQGMYRRADLNGGGSRDAPLPRPRTPQEAAALPPGTRFIDPQGIERTVPGGQSRAGSGNFPRRGGTLTINRNNNPGALRVPGSTEFQRFSSPAEGVRAQQAQLRRYHTRGLRTVSAIVETYAPRQSRGGDNTDAQVNNYVRHVATQLGVSPGETIPADRIPELAAAMRQFETGTR